MPDLYNGGLSGSMPIATYTATHQINGGTAIPANSAAAVQNITFTGLALADGNVAFTCRDALVIPKGLSLTSAVVTADNTLSVQWRNNTLSAITPPASATWTAVVYKPFFLVD
jgi:hypothetical protein